MSSDLDLVWKALADATRREILDLLRAGPRTTTEIVERFPALTRFGVMKHLQVLRDAGLVNTRQEGRRCLNSLNAVPIRRIYERWVSRFEEFWATTLLGLEGMLEATAENQENRDRPDSRTTEEEHGAGDSGREGEARPQG
jgi:DNA-binding transcriptional ArsR family regulator